MKKPATTKKDNSRQKNFDPYTVVIMGAGCSKGLGLPLLSGFMDKAFDYRPASNSATSGGKDKAKKEYEDWLFDIQNHIKLVKASKAYIQSDLLNVEELYGLADLYNELNPSPKKETTNAQKALEAFRSVFLELMAHGGQEIVDPSNSFPDTQRALEQVKLESMAYDFLVKSEGTKHATLLAYLCIATHKDIDDSRPLFVQFNWDMALDRALCRAYLRTTRDPGEETPLIVPGPAADFGSFERLVNSGDEVFRIGVLSNTANRQDPLFPWTAGSDTKGRYREFPVVAKPHGALNWIKAKKKNGRPGWALLKAEKSAYRDKPVNDFNVNQQMVQIPGKTPQAVYKTLRNLMEIIPPTWRKDISTDVIRMQWKEIECGLRNCRRLVFVGYSMPITDVYFRHFLALAMASNDKMPNVYVWNPSVFKPGPARTSYLDTFAPLAAEGRLFGIRGRFGEPALLDLNRAIQSAERLDPDPS